MPAGYIDLYCERTGPGLWAEPVNALTNLAFLAAALLLARLLAQAPPAVRRDPACWSLVGLVFAIAVGSALFHSFARRWAMLADVLPIALFILVYTWFALRRFAGFGRAGATAGVAAVLAVALAVPPLTGFRGGSYVAALLALVVIGGGLRIARRRAQAAAAGTALLGAAALFAVSLALRTADAPLCAAFPLGTHFAWHLCNAAVLYIVARAMIRTGVPAGAPPVRPPPAPAC